MDRGRTFLQNYIKLALVTGRQTVLTMYVQVYSTLSERRETELSLAMPQTQCWTRGVQPGGGT